ncbi:MAG TPA: threonine synthase, partial [Candidatus Omnitrophota bacterium]|nr:threonine synthase [Candidatus Omnitrophota bacterium]
MKWNGIINHYKDFLPVSEKTPVVTLLEGNTPLIPSETLSKKTGLKVFLKYEGLNPTGSFKDRGMTMAISKAKEKGARVVMCASTGNTSASAAAYAVRSGTMKCVVLIPDGNIALGKLAQAMIHQAQVIAIKGNFDDALNLVRTVTDRYPVELVNSINPFRIEGQKTAAFEICDCLDDAP